MALPRHTQLEEEVHGVGLLESEESFNVSDPTANSLLSEPQFTHEIPELLSTVPDLSQLEHLVEERRARRFTTCTSLNTIIQRNKSLIDDIETYEIPLSVFNDVAGVSGPRQSSHQRAVKKTSSLTKQRYRLVNASNSVLTLNNILITECQVILREESKFHSSGNTNRPQNEDLVNGNKDLVKENDDLVCFLGRITPLLDILENLNDQLLKHLNIFESQPEVARVAKTEPLRTDSSSSMGLLSRLSCFH